EFRERVGTPELCAHELLQRGRLPVFTHAVEQVLGHGRGEAAHVLKRFKDVATLGIARLLEPSCDTVDGTDDLRRGQGSELTLRLKQADTGRVESSGCHCSLNLPFCRWTRAGDPWQWSTRAA